MKGTINDLHDLLEKHCSNEYLGFCVNISWLCQKFKDSLKKQKLKFPIGTNNPKLDVGLLLNPDDIVLSETQGELRVAKFEAIVEVLGKGQKVINSYKLSYNSSTLGMTVMNGKFKFEVDKFNGYVMTPGIPNEQVILDSDLTVEEYLKAESLMFTSLNLNMFFDYLVSSIPFPKLDKALNFFTVVAPFMMVFEANYIVIYGKPLFVGGCSHLPNFYEVEETVTCVAKPDSNKENHFTGFSINAQQTVINKRNDEPQKNVVSSDLPICFYLPRSKTFQIMADSTFGPAIAGGDSDTSFFLDWQWNASAQLKSLSVSLGNPIIISAPMRLGGSASFAVGIGCLKVGMSASVFGGVDPAIYNLSIVDIAKYKSEVYVTCSASLNIDVNFHGIPILDIAMNVFMDSIGNEFLACALRSKASSLNFKLIDMQIAKAFEGKFGWISLNDIRKNSTAIAIRDNEG
jgi:hypothetical protein